jgi:hypothetical protein
MLKQLHKALTHKEEYFQLAISTECDIKLPLLDDVVIYFSATWANDDKWRFWMDYRGLITLIGTIEQIKDEDGAYPNENIPEECLVKITSNFGSISKILATLLPELLYDHIILWEDKINYDNDDCNVEVNPTHIIPLHEAKQKLSSHYQLMKDFLDYINSSDNTTPTLTTLLQYDQPSGTNGSLTFDGDRKSFVTRINGNCVEETETPILSILLARVNAQRFLTLGQLRILQFLKNHSDGNL